MEISLDFKIVSFSFDLNALSVLHTSSLFLSFPTRLEHLLSKRPRHTYLSLLLASVPSLKYNDLDDEAKRMLTEAAKTRGVTLKL